MNDKVTTAREAAVAEMLQDVEALAKRLEEVGADLSDQIEQATKDAAGKAFLAATFTFKEMIEQQQAKLTDAGRHSAALIGNALNASSVQLLAASDAGRRRAVAAMAATFAAGLLGALLGGLIVAKAVGAL